MLILMVYNGQEPEEFKEIADNLPPGVSVSRASLQLIKPNEVKKFDKFYVYGTKKDFFLPNKEIEYYPKHKEVIEPKEVSKEVLETPPKNKKKSKKPN